MFVSPIRKLFYPTIPCDLIPSQTPKTYPSFDNLKTTTYSSCSSIPLSFRPFSCAAASVWFVDEKNSRSACSGSGVGVSKINVSTMEPFDDPKDTLQWRKMKKLLDRLGRLKQIVLIVSNRWLEWVRIWSALLPSGLTKNNQLGHGEITQRARQMSARKTANTDGVLWKMRVFNIY